MSTTITVLENDVTSRVIEVEDILFAAPAMTVLACDPKAAESDDDDVPIAAILESKGKTKMKRKKVKQKRWDYVQVAEPTGVGSNYWDAAAPVERATKRVAKQKIRELQDGELDAALLPDGKVVSLVPDVWGAARKEKTKRTGTQRRSDLQAFMANQRRIDLQGVTEPTGDATLTLSTGSGTTTQTCLGKPKVFICFRLCTIESPYCNCLLCFCDI